MPTENKSSNEQKMVSVPRELLELAWLELIDRWSWAAELRALLDAPTEQHQGEPVGYAAFRDGRYGSWLHPTREEAEMVDALDGAPANSKIVPVYDHAAPVQQGEPVACRYRINDGTDRAWTYRDGVVSVHMAHYELEELYKNADSGEVERLRDTHCNLANLYGKQRLELEAMRSRLAEREALLVKATEFVKKLRAAAGDQPSVATGYLSDILDALSASAEPEVKS